jgi:hypothetical protein
LFDRIESTRRFRTGVFSFVSVYVGANGGSDLIETDHATRLDAERAAEV